MILAARPDNGADPLELADAVIDDLGLVAVAAAHVVDRAATPLLTRGPLGADVERLHFELGEGPGLDAWALARPVDSEHLTGDARWTTFSLAAAAVGVEAMWAHPLVIAGSNDGPVGWVAFARSSPGRLPAAPAHLDLVAAVLGHLAVRADATGRRRDADEALEVLVRDVVHTATGMLAQRLDLDVAGAARQLRATARTSGRSLTELAVEIAGLGTSTRG